MFEALRCSNPFGTVERQTPLHEVDSHPEIRALVVPVRVVHLADRFHAPDLRPLFLPDGGRHVLDEDVRVEGPDELVQVREAGRFDGRDVGQEGPVCSLDVDLACAGRRDTVGSTYCAERRISRLASFRRW